MGEKLKEILKDGALAADIDLTDSQLDKFDQASRCMDCGVPACVGRWR